jgi:hypothetical protein
MARSRSSANAAQRRADHSASCIDLRRRGSYGALVSDVDGFVAIAWRDGVGPDDRATIDALGASIADPELALFAALCRLSLGEHVMIPATPGGAPATVVHAAAVLLATLQAPGTTLELARHIATGPVPHTAPEPAPRTTPEPAPRTTPELAPEPAHHAALIDRAAAALGAALEALPADDPRAVAAEAWADLALGELAIAVGDVRVARHRFEAVAATGRPVALRIAAMLRLIGLAAERRDLEAARGWARKAAALAGAQHREVHAGRAQLSCGLLDYAVGDLAAMRGSLAAVTGEGGVAAIARILLATAEPGPRAMQLLADTLAEAITTGDSLIYALCVLVGTRRYRLLGRPEDAEVTLAAGIEQLRNLVPHLANLLIAERAGPAG